MSIHGKAPATPKRGSPELAHEEKQTDFMKKMKQKSLKNPKRSSRTSQPDTGSNMIMSDVSV
jgi:hypothetical protein